MEAGRGDLGGAMTDKQKEILLRTLGLDVAPDKLPRRNYLYAAYGSVSYGECEDMIDMGLMERVRERDGGPYHVRATVEGVQVCLGLRFSRERIEQWFKTSSWKRAKL